MHVRLNKIRREAGLSLSQMAERTGVSKAMLGQIERGESSPTVGTLWKIAKGLHVPFSVLIDGPSRDTPESAGPHTPAVSDTDVIYSTLHAYDPMFGSETFLVTLAPGQTYISVPHDAGIFEDVFVAEGAVEVLFDGEWHPLKHAESLRFPADRDHGYRNAGVKRARINVVMHHLKDRS